MELNEHQLLAVKIMNRQYNELIGGCENTMMDYNLDDPEYIDAYNTLHSPFLTEIIYKWVITEATERGYAKHIKFAGADFIKDRIKQKLVKDGYYYES